LKFERAELDETLLKFSTPFTTGSTTFPLRTIWLLTQLGSFRLKNGEK
jgi:hypothetical protein